LQLLKQKLFIPCAHGLRGSPYPLIILSSSGKLTRRDSFFAFESFDKELFNVDWLNFVDNGDKASKKLLKQY